MPKKVGRDFFDTDASADEKSVVEDSSAEIIKPVSIQSPVDIESDEYLDYISTVFGYVTSLIELEDHDTGGEFEWHEAQLLWMQMDGHRIMNKCRQMGGSTVLAAETFAKAQLVNQDYAFIFFSIKKEEAQNKIAYIKQFMHNSPLKFRRKTVYETKQSIEFLNSDGSTTKIISHAQKPSRGLHGDSKFDEADFYNDFQTMYDATLPGTKKVGGNISIISTPFNPNGLFREILLGTDGTIDKDGQIKKKHQNYNRMVVCWWNIPFYCVDMEEAARMAPYMSTRERVYKYGTQTLIEAYQDSRNEEIFKQEYESAFTDEKGRFFNLDRLKEAVFRNPEEFIHEDYSLHWNQEVDPNLIDEDSREFMFPMEKALYDNNVYISHYGGSSDENDIEHLYAAVSRGEIKGSLVCGMDIGTTGHATDIRICEELFVNNSWVLIERFSLNKNKWALHEQQEYVRTKILDKLPIRKMGIDTNGLGMQIGQYLYNLYPSIVEQMPMLVKNLDRTLYALEECLGSNAFAIAGYEETIKAIKEVRRDNTSLNTSKWTLKKTDTTHCDAAISLGICSALFIESKHKFGFGGHFTPKERNQKKINQNLIEMARTSDVDKVAMNHNRKVNKLLSRAKRSKNSDLASLANKLRIER